MYNKQLQCETTKRMQEMNISNAKCLTIHGLVRRITQQQTENSVYMKRALDWWHTQMDCDESRACLICTNQDVLNVDVVMVDEAQDLNSVLVDALQLFLQCIAHVKETPPRLVLVGDPKQLLYDFFPQPSTSASDYLMKPEQTKWDEANGT
eukprot:6199586-Pleurochrysis_carterae.AAC.1